MGIARIKTKHAKQFQKFQKLFRNIYQHFIVSTESYTQSIVQSIHVKENKGTRSRISKNGTQTADISSARLHAHAHMNKSVYSAFESS